MPTSPGGSPPTRLCECGSCGLPTPLATKTRAERGLKKGEPRAFIPGHKRTLPADAVATSRQHATLGKLADLLDRSGIPVEEIGRVEKIKVWQGFLKDNDGNAQTVDLAGIQLVPTWADGPEWPVVQPAPVVKIKPKVWTPPVRDHLVAVEIPNLQAGFWVDRYKQLHSTHDEAAIDVCLRIVELVQPDLVIVGGDGADFPEFGKYRLSPVFFDTTQPTVNYLGAFAARLRDVAGPECEIVWLPGNHEERLPNYILDNARAAFRLRRANTPSSWPVLTLPNLCDFDAHGIRWVPGYPANEWWVNDRLRVIHGNRVRSGGSTAHVYLNEERVSTIFNHVHRREWAERTRHTRYGPRTILSASAGCLCKIDGSVPSTKGGIDVDGHPIPVTEDWQQGCMVISYLPGDSPFGVEMIPIHDGRAYFRGAVIEAERLEEEVAA